MIGIPGSGKSYFAKELAKKERAILLSTDDIRCELFGDEGKQGKANLVYRELFTRLDTLLKGNQNIVIDATNIERERRMKSLKKIGNVEKHCYYFSTPYEVCVERNQSRKRTVDMRILEKMRRNLQVPLLNEGWDYVHIVHEPYPYPLTKEELISLAKSEGDYEPLFQTLKRIPMFKEMYGFDQENPHHQFPLCQHTYYVYQYVNEYYEGKDKLVLQLAALFHDTGKLYTKTFKKLKGYYSYFGHENVSAQLTYHMLMELGFDQQLVKDVVGIVQMHMLINYGGDQGASEIYHLLGDDLLTKLYIFREGDQFAK